jgi:hypothetical protein
MCVCACVRVLFLRHCRPPPYSLPYHPPSPLHHPCTHAWPVVLFCHVSFCFASTPHPPVVVHGCRCSCRCFPHIFCLCIAVSLSFFIITTWHSTGREAIRHRLYPCILHKEGPCVVPAPVGRVVFLLIASSSVCLCFFVFFLLSLLLPL